MSIAKTTTAAIAVLGLALASAALAQGRMPGRGPMTGGRGGWMGHGMGYGMGMGCPMLAPGVELQVAKIANGVTLTLTSSDPKVAARIQKRAEILRLMHELEAEEEAEGQ
jgi:hypothetical protein